MEIIEHISNLPMLGNDTIHIWGARVPELEDRLAEMQTLLCAEEAAKAERFHRPADRAASIVARGALRVLLSGYTGIPAAEIKFHYLETGKPYVPDCDVAFNISHSGEWVVLAIGRNRNVGVDVEKIRWDMDVMEIASRYFTPEEALLIESSEDIHALFFHHWSRKEAYVKAIGSGLFRELSSFSVPNEDGEKDGWYFQRLEAGSKYAAAVVSDRPINILPCYDFAALSWNSCRG
ncbi:4'-phosphopantetheinyl transferase superfamily protein [Pontiellaceae bacterium B1224]|nr:4'-phosphopantetheinyl transferase superfamily protein [Pontiellaceae bacterium B1224]